MAATVNDSELSIPGYVLFRKDRNLDYYNGIYSQATRGGVLAYVKGDLHPTISELNSVPAELLWLNIYPSITSLGVCYRPELAGHNYVETLCASFNQVQVRDCIIVGDFNFRDIDWQDFEGHSPSSRLFLQCLQDNYMTQLVEEPTRNKYINDLVITSNSDLIDSVIVSDAFPYTDHKTLTVNVKLFIPKISKKQRKVYLYSKGRYAEFNRAVSEFDWQGTLARYQSMEQKWAIFKHTLFLLQDEYIPSKTLKPGTRSRFPWLSNPKVKHERKMKRKAQVKANISGLYSDTVLSQAASTQYRAQLLRSKAEYEASLASDIRENPRRFYSYCRNFTRSGATIESLKVNGETITHDHDKANALNEFFASVMVKEPDELPYISSNDKTKDILETIDFSSKDIFDLLLQVNPNKAQGPDEIHPRILREVPTLCEPLHMLFRFSLERAQLPRDWTTANICALHKKGSRTSTNNYRPVSLTSQVVKVLERLILRGIQRFSDVNGIITCDQHGFQSKCSCLTNLLECLNDWTQAFDEPRTGIDIVYTDFRKAFDSVPHQRLLLKLKNYGIQGRLHRWLGSFLTNRLQRVILNGTYSDWARVISGVPQGTILGPLLFLFYINDLPEHVKSTAKMFADDCKIYTRIANTSDCVTLQDDLNSLSAWSRQWLLGFSKEKCVVIRVKKALDFIYCIDGHALECVSEQNDLGVTISNELKPSKHIDSIIKKANQRLGMIRRCFTNRSANVIVPISTSLIRPFLETNSAAG